MSFEYVKEYYGVPAEFGRVVVISGKKGIIAADRGHYIGVNLDSDKPGVICNAHPTSNVEYLGMGKIRKPTRSQNRYQNYIDSEVGESFGEFIKYGWYKRYEGGQDGY